MKLTSLIDGSLDAAANAFDMTLGRGLADMTPMPSTIIDTGPQRAVHRYRLPDRAYAQSPVLLVPPLAAPPSCFDLRRGCSVVEHLVSRGYPTYLVDYGPIGFADRQLGLDHWVSDVLPEAVRVVAEDAASPAQLVGWSLGGIFVALAVAGTDLPVSSATLFGSPFDFARIRAAAPIRQLAELTGGRIVTALYRLLGIAPAALVSLAFQLTAIDKRLTRPLALARYAADRDALAQIEAVDAYMGRMLAYPGRSFAELYHRFFRINDLADGRVDLGDHEIDLADVSLPLLVIAGESDVLAPVDAVYHVADLVPRADVELRTVPGGHLGILTGRGARETSWRYLDAFLRRNDEAGP